MKDDSVGQKVTVNEEQIVEAPQSINSVPNVSVRLLRGSLSTYSVKNTEYLDAANIATATIVEFQHGAVGQHLYIRGDGNTIIAPGGNIFNISDDTLLLSLNIVYHYVAFSRDNRISWHQVGV